MKRFLSRRRTFGLLLRLGVGLLVLYLLAAYVVAPAVWRRYTRLHPALDAAPQITHTANGISGDPLNVALVGTEKELVAAMLAAQWFPADPVTLKSSLKIALDTVFHRTYADAPVSSLFVWGRKQDLAFEQPAGGDPRRRHHVRFWRSEQVDEDGRPLWIGAATFDTKVGFSHTTGQITHHIAPDVDAERDKLMNDLSQASRLTAQYWVDGFQETLEGRNGGGDPYHTDGRLAVGCLATTTAAASATPAKQTAESTQDDRHRRLLIGVWEDDYQGHRTMVLQEDGTGTMVVELSGLKASLFAPRMRFDMVWSVEGGRLKKRTLGGEPETQVQMILKTMGDRVDEPIVELTEERLILLDRDGKTKYEWRRVAPKPPARNDRARVHRKRALSTPQSSSAGRGGTSTSVTAAHCSNGACCRTQRIGPPNLPQRSLPL